MPLQNRVAPTGEIVCHPGRGLLMGNRGCIHRPDRTLGVTRWRSALWISCVLYWQARRRDVMPPGRWTALFFLDEATALAAGHRPCGYCRRADHLWFATSWQVAYGLRERPRAVQMDRWLHSERVNPRTRRQVRWMSRAGALPSGAMVARDGAAGLWCDGSFLPWSFGGYGDPVPVRASTRLAVLTPPSIVAALTAGYRPLVHPSAGVTPLRSFEPGAMPGCQDYS